MRKVKEEVLRVSEKWLAGEIARLEEIVMRAEKTIEAARIDLGECEWHDLREIAASLLQTASQMQAQAAVMTVIDPTEDAKKARGQ
jgi:hypothetical protein